MFCILILLATEILLSEGFPSGTCSQLGLMLRFRQGDLRSEGFQWFGGLDKAKSPSPSTLVVAVHACNQATLDVLDLATTFGTSWAVVPCCMRKEKFFPGGTTHLDRDEHYPVMCGTLCAKFGADMLHSIDPLISTKNLIIAKRAPRVSFEPTCAG